MWVVKVLLELYEVNPESRDNSGRRLLFWAVEHGNQEVVELPLERESRDNPCRAPLSYAARGVSERIFELLLELGDVDLESRDNYG